MDRVRAGNESGQQKTRPVIRPGFALRFGSFRIGASNDTLGNHCIGYLNEAGDVCALLVIDETV